VVLILAGGAIYAIAFWRYRQECQHLARQGAAVTPPWTLGFLTAALLLVALLAGSDVNRSQPCPGSAARRILRICLGPQ
jgi:hypothetical protein